MLPLFSCLVALIRAETFTINTKTQGRSISSNFASVTIDIQLVWHWSDFPFTNTEMNTLAKGLNDTVLRFSGTADDYVIYNISGNITHADLEPKQVKYLNFNQFSQMIHFASNNGWKFTMGLDAQYRFKNNTWDPYNTNQLIDAIIETNDNNIMDILTFELGNEPNMYPSSTGQYFGFQNVSGQQGARDVLTLYNLIQSKSNNFKSNVKIWGPDVTQYGMAYLDDYLSELKNLNKISILDAITSHFYYGSGTNWNINDFVNISTLDSLIPFINQSVTVSAKYAPNTRVILGESGIGYAVYANTNASTFVAGFLWLDKLGIASVMGINTICRQTFWGGYEGFVGQGINPVMSSSVDYNPNPTYWIAYLWKQIIGTKVVFVNNELDYGRNIRVYAFCTRTNDYYKYTNGDITVVVLNVQNNTANVQLNIDNGINGQKFDVFMMSAVSGVLNSRNISINGKLMELVNNSTFPQIESVTKPYGSIMTMQPYTYAYVVAVGARAQICIPS
eukprot:316142_1